LGGRKLDDGCTAWRERWKVVTLVVARVRGLCCWVGERWMTTALLGEKDVDDGGLRKLLLGRRV
jgi:hypothetical protein